MTARVLLFGGIDPSGGAGLSADTRALCAHDALALPVATALTVQNRRGVVRVDAVAPDLWRAAAQSAIADGPVDAVKTGLLVDADQIAAVAEVLVALRRMRPGLPVVVDPVLSATAGGYRAGDELVAACRERLLPLATVLTPNLPEHAALFGGEAVVDAPGAGCRAVLLKGGHGAGDELVDRLIGADGDRTWRHPRLPTGPVHGTGCALASALAAHLAVGAPLVQACGAAIGWLQQRLRQLLADGPGDGLPRPLP